MFRPRIKASCGSYARGAMVESGRGNCPKGSGDPVADLVELPFATDEPQPHRSPRPAHRIGDVTAVAGAVVDERAERSRVEIGREMRDPRDVFGAVYDHKPLGGEAGVI